MVFFLKKTGISFSIHKFLPLFCLLFSQLIPNAYLSYAQAASEKPTLNKAWDKELSDLKKTLLDDPLFLSRLRDRLSVETLQRDGIRLAIREYLLENPEILFEMQEILEKKEYLKTAQNAKHQEELIKKSAQTLFHNDKDLVLGQIGDSNKDTVTLIEFYDYNCRYCKRAYHMMKTLLAKDKNIKFILKDYPILGRDSVQVHLLAHAFQKLMPDKYVSLHELFMKSDQERLTEEKAMKLAVSLGAKEEDLRIIMQDPDLQDLILKPSELAYELGINYTPAYILGTRVLPGAMDEEGLLKAIENERKQKQ